MAGKNPMITGMNAPQIDCDLCQMYNTTEGGRARQIWSNDQILNLNTMSSNNRITIDNAFMSCQASSCVFNEVP